MKAADVPRTHDRSAACGTSCFANVCMPILNPLDVAGTAQPPDGSDRNLRARSASELARAAQQIAIRRRPTNAGRRTQANKELDIAVKCILPG